MIYKNVIDYIIQLNFKMRMKFGFQHKKEISFHVRIDQIRNKHWIIKNKNIHFHNGAVDLKILKTFSATNGLHKRTKCRSHHL